MKWFNSAALFLVVLLKSSEVYAAYGGSDETLVGFTPDGKYFLVHFGDEEGDEVSTLYSTRTGQMVKSWTASRDALGTVRGLPGRKSDPKYRHLKFSLEHIRTGASYGGVKVRLFYRSGRVYVAVTKGRQRLIVGSEVLSDAYHGENSITIYWSPQGRWIFVELAKRFAMGRFVYDKTCAARPLFKVMLPESMRPYISGKRISPQPKRNP